MNDEPSLEWWQQIAGGDAPMARRRFLRRAAGATGATLAAGLWQPIPARADDDDDDDDDNDQGDDHHHRTPASYTKLLTNNPYQSVAENGDASSIYNFKGHIAAALIKGTGTGFGKNKNGKEIRMKLYFHTDMRTMIGQFVPSNNAKIVLKGSFVSF